MNLYLFEHPDAIGIVAANNVEEAIILFDKEIQTTDKKFKEELVIQHIGSTIDPHNIPKVLASCVCDS